MVQPRVLEPMVGGVKGTGINGLVQLKFLRSRVLEKAVMELTVRAIEDAGAMSWLCQGCWCGCQ